MACIWLGSASVARTEQLEVATNGGRGQQAEVDATNREESEEEEEDDARDDGGEAEGSASEEEDAGGQGTKRFYRPSAFWIP